MSEVAPRFPALETDRLVLRSFVDDDTDFVFRHFSDPDVARYLLDCQPLRERSEAGDLIEFYRTREGAGPNRWCVVRRADNKAIGTCGFHEWSESHRRAEIGYDLSPQAQGQGYMTEAVRAAIKHAFDRMELNRIDALVYGDNARSIRLVERLGFQADGVLRDHFCLNGTFYDHRLFALLKRDWNVE